MAALRIFVLLAISFFVANAQEVSSYWAEKPGSCPPRLTIDICTRSCYADWQCRGKTKCCQTNCGGTVCSRPVTIHPSLEKPGSCPAQPTGRWICSSTCRSDGDCPIGTTKCCKNRCGAFVCQQPEIEEVEIVEIPNNFQPDLTNELFPNSGNPYIINN